MEQIRLKLLKSNLEYINKHKLSVTKITNKLINFISTLDAHTGDDFELRKNLQELIQESKK